MPAGRETVFESAKHQLELRRKKVSVWKKACQLEAAVIKSNMGFQNSPVPGVTVAPVAAGILICVYFRGGLSHAVPQ
jgi:hypothetical protein